LRQENRFAKDPMPELIFAGPDGRLEGRYHAQPKPDAPIAIILHPHPQYGGTMNNRVVYNLHYAFHKIGFTVMRFNFRGVGRSQGEFDQGIGELSDAAARGVQHFSVSFGSCNRHTCIIPRPCNIWHHRYSGRSRRAESIASARRGPFLTFLPSSPP